MDLKKVSVIVPVYNASEHLNLCIDSILNQTYKNIEIVIVNDGSTDDSIKIINNYKNNYPNKIIIINKENSGVADTRNIGLNNANGEYVTFCDNDDYMEPDYIECYVNSIEDNDIVVGGYIRKSYFGKILFKRKLKPGKISPYVQLASWGKLYRNSFLKENNFRFLDCAIADDFYFNIFAYNTTDKIKIIDNTGYYWMYNDKSLSNTDSKKMNRTKDLTKTLDKINNDIVPKDKELLEYFYIRTIIYYVLFSCKNVKYNALLENYNFLFGWLIKNTDNYMKNKYIKLFNMDGEQYSVKFIIYIFVFLQRIKLIKPFLWLYSKV